MPRLDFCLAKGWGRGGRTYRKDVVTAFICGSVELRNFKLITAIALCSSSIGLVYSNNYYIHTRGLRHCSIGYSAFGSCDGLITVNFNATNCIAVPGFLGSRSIFSYCTNLTALSIGNNVTTIPDYAFRDCTSLTSVFIPNSVSTIGEGAFYGCTSLTTVNIPDGVTTISRGVFKSCNSLAFVSIPNSVTSIGDDAFLETALTSITIPNSVVSIGSGAFFNCEGLTSVTIPNSVTKIGGSAFAECSNLITITIGSAVDSIGVNAFGSCASLDTIFFLAETPPVITLLTFYEVQTDVPIIVPCGSSNAYINAPYWKALPSIHESDSCYRMLTLSVSNNSLGSVRGAGSYSLGSQVELLAIPTAGDFFVGWNDANTDNPRIVTINSDTTFTAFFDAGAGVTVIHDTSYVDNYIFDTTYVNNYIHDTTYIDNYIHDTTCVDNYIHDTTYVDNWIHDTTYVDKWIHDTTYVDNWIHDTTYVDNWIHDTTYVDNWIYDTSYVDNYVHDTTYVDNWIYDTTIVVDTLWLTQYDTVWLHDTVFIHDTITVGVKEVDALDAKVYVSQGRVVVEGAEGNEVTLFDINGRSLATKQDYYEKLYFDVPASGGYLIKIGNHPARKVVVIR